jgi:hypothetical protein
MSANKGRNFLNQLPTKTPDFLEGGKQKSAEHAAPGLFFA